MKLLASGINRFHKTTLESVILREIGVAAGDTLGAADVEDVERRLRQLRIFASVSARLITTNDGAELHISTRDNFSIVAGASGSYLGGVGNVGFKTGDNNLFGTGNKLIFGLSRNTTDNFRGSLSFSDLHFFDQPWRASYRVGRTDEGDFYGATFGDPFRSLDDNGSWSLTADRTEKFVKYYQDGNTVVQIPEDRATLAGKYIWRTGSQEKYIRRGLIGTLTQVEYEVAAGESANSIEVPEDNRTLYVGGLLARDSVSSYLKLQGLDTLNYVQDVALGSSAELQFGLNYIDEFDAAAERTEPRVSLVLNHSRQAKKSILLKATLAASSILEDGGDKPWSATAALRSFYTGFKDTTLAARIEYKTGEDGVGLPVQLTLGENNGLRGYDARQFAGRHRGRVNLEARYRTGWKLSVLDIGLVGFVDSGWTALADESAVTVRNSIGAGLRFGSNALLGAKVIRLDMAVPLDAPVGEDSDPRFSFAVGQVFRF